MQVIKVDKAFKHSDDGNTVNDYEPGTQLVSDRCAEVAIKHLKTAKATKIKPEDFNPDQEAEEAAPEE